MMQLTPQVTSVASRITINVAPARVIRGSHILEDCGRELALLGQRPLVIGGDRSLRGVEPRLLPVLEEQGLRPQMASYLPDCSESSLETLRQAVVDHQADCIIGVGGGKALDTAKLIAHQSHLAIATKKGSFHLAEASEAGFTEKASIRVFDKVAWTQPAYADGRFYLRGFDGLARVDITRADQEVVDRQREETIMTRLIARVAGAEDKKAVIDAFMAEQETFPIIEGRHRVHFVYRGEARDVALGGDLVGARQERALTRVPDTDLFYLTVEVEPDAMLAYLFIVDFTEIIADPRNPRETQTTLLGKDMEMRFGGPPQPMSWFAMPDYRAPDYLEAETRISLTDHTIPSETAEDGVPIRVHVPEGYAESDEALPVAYVVNGREALGVGAWDRALTRIETAPFIAVFIQAPPGRGFQDTLIDEIVPFVEKTYRVEARREGRTLIAMGPGTFPLMGIIAKGHDTFGQMGLLSVFIMGNGVDAFIDSVAEIPSEEMPRFYMDWGTYDFRNPQEAWDMSVNTARLAKELRELGLEVATRSHNGGTDWTSWRTRTRPLLEALFPDEG